MFPEDGGRSLQRGAARRGLAATVAYGLLWFTGSKLLILILPEP